jgi:serine/threonine protein phosphatase PrpC
MGTTLVSLFSANDGIYVAHVGDSRAYRFRQGKLELLTEDHSLLNDYIKMKRLTEEEIANFPHKNVIVRALGMRDTVKVDTRFESPQLDDTYLLCSDGLSGPVTDPEIAEILGAHKRSTDGGLEAHRARQRARRPGQRHLRARSLDAVARRLRHLRSGGALHSAGPAPS